MGEIFSERYITLRKNRSCFKYMLNSKRSNSDMFSTFICPKTYEAFMVLNDVDDIEMELVKICDKKCNIKSKDLNL